MTTIKAIEGRSVHQIQSGQVIVDLTSVVKELVENSLDAGATSIDVRFKGQGLEALEIQDNGSGISRDDYETLALKHYTSKLSNYDDLADLNTFGFRGEAISSLCALSNLYIVTAQDGEAPKGTKLEFEQSGKLKGNSVAATQKGTLVVIENLFQSLPVRRRELEKNIKREYSKAITHLNAYACVSTGVRFSVSQQAAKGKKVNVFSTRNNSATIDNIAEIYGRKTTLALVALNLSLEMEPTMPSQILKGVHAEDPMSSRQIRVEGHISKPVHGEGRQTPDRQMFFVNSRPCGLPQVAKAFNEVYKSYNMNQSPFVFANLKMDTNTYDVNVSPDKRIIMLHDQQRLLETLKGALVDLFESQDQTVPTQQIQPSKLPSFKPHTVSRDTLIAPTGSHRPDSPVRDLGVIRTEASLEDEEEYSPRRGRVEAPKSSSSTLLPSSVTAGEDRPAKLIGDFAGRHAQERSEDEGRPTVEHLSGPSRDKQKLARKFERQSVACTAASTDSKISTEGSNSSRRSSDSLPKEAVSAGGSPDGALRARTKPLSHSATAQGPGAPPIVMQTPMRPSAGPPVTPAHQGVMTVGPTMSRVASGPSTKRRRVSTPVDDKSDGRTTQSSQLSSSLHAFAAPGTQYGTRKSQDGTLPSFFKQASKKEDPEGHDDVEYHSSESAAVSEDEGDEEAHDHASEAVPQGTEQHESLREDEKHKEEEESRVQRMVEDAEASSIKPFQASQKRMNLSRRAGETVHNLVKFSAISLSDLRDQWLAAATQSLTTSAQRRDNQETDGLSSQVSAEERLSLTISKSDFACMRVVGQFNLGFILAVRPSSSSVDASHTSDELFIIDQHASDEIYNFHRLSASTTLTPQPLVRPHPLQLTAIEEETIIDHKDASLAKNGFNIAIDTSGDRPVGERCSVLTLPTSKETIFNIRDLEELLTLLEEAPAPTHLSPPLPDVDTSEHLEGVPSHRTLPLGNTPTIVRPTKIRKMLAMRACRSSIMVGKALTETGMSRVVRHMGEIERPWNCPHGRPTMRHLSRLDKVGGWDEWGTIWNSSMNQSENDEGDTLGDGVWLPNSSELEDGRQITDEDSIWRGWIAAQHHNGGMDCQDEQEEDREGNEEDSDDQDTE